MSLTTSLNKTNNIALLLKALLMQIIVSSLKAIDKLLVILCYP